MPITASGALTTVFCAVWHQDEDRHDLLRSHVACLEAQTVPVEVVYVFDAGDEPPPGLPGVHAVADHALHIYQAWNVATQVARTRFVMNLNLDDRLAPDAVELLQLAATANEAGVVGADWEITFDRETTDAVAPTRLASTLPYDPSWPPRPGVRRRLGSGTAESNTLGVGTLWRRDLHDVVPYPWRFEDGAPIRSVGDTVWWRVVDRAMRATAVRLPLVVGNYHSHPADQAEFRLPDERDRIGDPIDIAPYPLDGIAVRRPDTRPTEGRL